MRPVDDSQRMRLFHISASLCSVALLLAPLAARSSIPPRDEAVLFSSVSAQTVAPAKEPVAALTIERDPFEPPRNMTPPQSAAPGMAPVSRPLIGMTVHAGESMGYTVPVSDTASEPGAPRLRAIVTGRSATALVEDGSSVRIVRVGDALAGSTIIKIDSEDVVLANGDRLVLAEDNR